MKKINNLLWMASCLLSTSLESPAQIRVSYTMDSPSFTFAHADTDKYRTLDSSYLDITYRFRYRASAHDDSLSREDLMELQMGRRYNAFFSRTLRDTDIQNTESLKTEMSFTPPSSSCIGFDLLLDHSDSMLIETNRLPYTSQVIEYKEKEPIIDWSYVPEDTLTVLGYPCRAAVCSYGGRDWKVYYTEEIPLPYGPWKLNGARGMVLKALDTENNFVFEAAGLTQRPCPVIRYEWNRKEMEKEKWRKYESDIYRNAGAFARNTGANILIIDNSERGFHRLDEEWSEYYDPLERQ